ncbi:hypothetical protein [Thalassospira sp.]|uniref:hypothetical protein n=1 Tax=Thalassospira sp. TaxID=1912094 RepID=UPI00273569EF|nr:hypothetical protein [Thalassospira sp.]MDP2699169.1 hypothetical protein [Thalassospira sp.]
MSARGNKPEYRRLGLGVETAETPRPVHDDMILSNRRSKRRRVEGREKDDETGSGGWRTWFRPATLLRFMVTLALFGGVLHGLFVVFGIYDRNQRLANVDHFALLIKVVVFLALIYLFYAMLMHYRPIRHKVRTVFFMALAPVVAVCIFMIYGGGNLFGSFLPVLQFLTLTVGVGGFLLYVLLHTWIAGGPVRREARRMEVLARDQARQRQQTPRSSPNGGSIPSPSGPRGGKPAGHNRVELPEI